MEQNKKAEKNSSNLMTPDVTGTNPNKVKREIQKDINAGQGAMTSREAGAMRD